MRFSLFIMLSALCLSVIFVCLLGGCATPSGRGRGGGLLDLACGVGGGLDDDGDELVLAEVLAAVDELPEVDASLHNAMLELKSASGWNGVASDGAARRAVDAHKQAVHLCNAMVSVLCSCLG